MRTVKALKKVLKKRHYEAFRRQFRKLLKFYSCKLCYPHIYKKEARKPVNDRKVLFIETTAKALSDNYKLIWEALEPYDYEKKLLLLEKNKGGQVDLHQRYKAIVREAADAKVIFLNDAFLAFGHIDFRPETKVVNTWHACGAFKKFGFGTADLNFGETRELQIKYPNYTFLDEMYVSAPEVIDKYAYSTGLPAEKVLPIGISRTDMFYDPEFRRRAEEKFRFYCPIAEGKKVILYAPTFRGTLKGAKAPDALNISMLQEALSDEYVLVIKEHPVIKKQLPISKKEQEFAVNFTNVMTIEELLCVTDICISDYSSLVFEFSLFEKPMIFFAFDKHEYDDWRGFYYDYEEMTPGPVFKKNKEIIDYIRHIDERFDRQAVIDFREKFMSSCDGHVTERIIARNFPDLEAHRAAKTEEPSEDNLPEAEAQETQQEAEVLLEKDQVMEKLLEAYPLLEGKRIIAYISKRDFIESYPHEEPYLDWRTYYEEAGEGDAVVYSHVGKGASRPTFTTDVFFRLPGEIKRRELLKAAEVIVTNNDRIVFDYLGEKPVYFLIPDYRWVCNSQEDYDQKTMRAKEMGLLYEDTVELARKIADTDSGMYTRAYTKEQLILVADQLLEPIG